MLWVAGLVIVLGRRWGLAGCPPPFHSLPLECFAGRRNGFVCQSPGCTPACRKKKKKSKPPKHGSRKGQLNFFPLSSLKPRGFHSCSRDQPGDSHRTEPSTGIPCADTVIRCLFRLPTFTLPNLTGGKLLY